MPAVAALAPLAPALIMGGASIIGGIMSSNAANKASQVQSQSADKALLQQNKQFEETRSDLSPYRAAGGSALTSLADLYGYGSKGPAFSTEALKGFTDSAFYKFPLQEGLRAVDAGAASKGMLNSEATRLAENNYAQDYASTKLGGYIQSLLGMTQIGQSAATATGQFGASNAAANTSLITGKGEAQAAGILGQQAGVNSALSGVITASQLGTPSAAFGATAPYNTLPPSMLTAMSGAAGSGPAATGALPGGGYLLYS